MAGIAFKQPCPSCEHAVPFRDDKLVGKKVECPKCKYKFVVQKPAGLAADAAAAVTAAKPTAPAKTKGKPGSLRDVDADDMAETVASSGGSRKKLYVGLGLGGVGLLILALASYIILFKPSAVVKKGTPFVPNNKNVDPEPEDDPDKVAKKIDPKVEVIPDKPKTPEFVGKAPGPELTNLLPNDTEHVFHGFFKDVFDTLSPFRGAISGDPHVLADGVFKPRLGFAITEIDDFIRADRFTRNSWTYTVIHLNELVDEKAVSAAFELKPMPRIKGHEYFQATKANPWFDQLSRVAVGVPQWLRTLANDDSRPLFVRFHNPQTLIFANETPLQELLKNDLQFPVKSGIVTPTPEPKETGPVVDLDKEKRDEDIKKKAGKPGAAGVAELFVDSVWEGKETRPGFGPIAVAFGTDARCTLTSPEGNTTGLFEYADNKITITFNKNAQYTGTVSGLEINGSAKLNQLSWKFSLRRVKGPDMVVEKSPEIPTPKSTVLPPIHSKSYLTVKPKLKEILDRLEAKRDDSPERPLYSTATELEPARVPSSMLPPDYRGRVVWRGKQVWDLATLLEERNPRIAFAGSALLQRGARGYQYRSEFECDDEKGAKNILKLADETLAPELARNFERYLHHKIEVPKIESSLPPNPGAIEPVPNKDASRWEATLRDQSVDVRIDLTFDNAALGHAQALAGLFALAARSEVDLHSDPRGRHLLGQAAAALALNGNPTLKIPAGAFPAGTMKRQAASSSRGGNTPYYRIGWMTSLLPYLGQDNLYQRIDWGNSWRDPSNWLSARTLVPEFLDASYPEASRHVHVPGLGVAPAATHIVGIAGVGLDAADYSRDDPAFASKRGVFGYDRSATLAEIQKGHGAANTIIMMQVPHDGLTGVSPWMAGGGSTLRGVPEKNSIAPFVLSKDKNGKPITNNGKRGTYAIMADGSVRFIDANIPDEVLKAMCTVNGPTAMVDFDKDDRLPLIPDPDAPKKAPPAKASPVVAEPRLELAPPPTKIEAGQDKKK